MNDNVNERLINGTGHHNAYIGFRLGLLSKEDLVSRFTYSYGEGWLGELKTHHEEIYSWFEQMLTMNNSKTLEMQFYFVSFAEEGNVGIVINGVGGSIFNLYKHFPSLDEEYIVEGYSSFQPSIFLNKENFPKFSYDFVLEIKGNYAHVCYDSECDQFYLVKDRKIEKIEREQVILPNDDMFFWEQFDKLLKDYIITSLEGNTPSCLRIIADCYDEYSNDVAKPNCFGLEKLLEFDRLDKWSEYCFEDSIQTVVSEVLRRF